METVRLTNDPTGFVIEAVQPQQSVAGTFVVGFGAMITWSGILAAGFRTKSKKKDALLPGRPAKRDQGITF